MTIHDDAVAVAYVTDAGDREDVLLKDVDPSLLDRSNGWAFVDRSALPEPLEAIAADRETVADGPEATPIEAGVVGVGEWALAGAIAAARRETSNGPITIVVPEGREVDPARTAYFIDEYTSPYTFGTDRSVLLVAAPRALGHRGLTYPDGTGYVTIEAFWDGTVGSTWLHEFVHAHQTFETTRGMRWFVEASAEYLNFRMMQAGYDGVTEEDLVGRLAALPEYPDATLSDPSTWGGEGVDYARGPRVLYAIDAAIRRGSDRTLFDVFRATNEHSEPISIDRFLEFVAEYTDDRWIEAAITEPGAIEWRRRSADVFR